METLPGLTTDELNEVELIDLPDNDKHPCNASGCNLNATWWYEHTCGLVTYRCDFHRLELDTALAFYDLKCKRCQNLSPEPIPWKALT